MPCSGWREGFSRRDRDDFMRHAGEQSEKEREGEEWQGKPSAKRERALQLCRTPFAEGWLFVRDKSGLRNLGVGT